MRGRGVAAIAVWAVSWAFAFAALAIAWWADLPNDPWSGVYLSRAPVEIRASFGAIGITVALVYGPVSALILARRPHPVGVILAVHAVGSGIAAFGAQWGRLGEEIEGLPLWGLLAFAAGWGYVPGTFMTAVLPLLLTRHRLPIVHVILVAVCAGAASLAFAASLVQQSVTAPVNPLAVDVPWLQARLPAAYTVLTFVVLSLSVVSWGVLVARWHRARGRDRTGLGWLVLGHLFLTLSYATLVLPDGLAPPRWVVDVGLVAPVVGQVVYPAALLVVVLGQRLWGVEVVVSRITLWALLTISAVVIYLLAVLVVPRLLPGSDGIWFVAPLVIALAVQPLRQWLQRRIDHLIYGEGTDPTAVLARLGHRLGELEPGAAGLRELGAALCRVLRLGGVEVRSTTSELHAVAGRAGTRAIVIALRSGGDLVGTLAAYPPEGQRLDRRTVAVLEDVAGLVAAAVRLIESNALLERARADLVARRAAERRAVRRELHDGIGPALAGIGFGLAAVENLATTQPGKAEQLLAELVDDLNRRVREVRVLADEMMPTTLARASLAHVIGDLVRRFDSSRLRVDAVIDEVAPLSAKAQRALYFVAAEAISNAARHAGARTIDVRIERQGLDVVLTVRDDGSGIRPGAEPGIGFASMSEHAHEFGGTMSVQSSTSGTTVTIALPLPPTVVDVPEGVPR